LNFPFFIAKRYLKTRRSHSAVNIISRISLVGVSVGAMALIIVLSVFNGFESVVVSLFNSFDPDIKITKVEGKNFHLNDFPQEKLKTIAGVKDYSVCLEEIALLTYGPKQQIATLKGVQPNYSRMSDVDEMLLEGDFVLQNGGVDFTVLGIGTEYVLGVNIKDKTRPIIAYAPDRTRNSASFSSAFVSDVLLPSGVFSVQEEFDSKYIFVSYSFVKELYKYTDEASSIEVYIDKNADVSDVKKDIIKLLGDNFHVKDRLEQQEFIYKIMKSEKWAVFLILSFILIIASFNVVGTLSMLIIEKKKDIFVLQSLGANKTQIRNIFLLEGTMIIFLGGLIGIIVGGIICWLQQQYGLIGFGGSGSFVVSAYPVKMIWTDFFFVLLTVFFIGFLATLYPVMKISQKSFKQSGDLKTH
jgi:lipoprotein-releasing system permease protein